MNRIFDRYLLKIFVRSFLICFVSLVGLYIVIDAFSNLDEFSERSDGAGNLVVSMAKFYGYRASLFFDQLSGVITAVAAMFTVSWIRRTNELTPMVSAGVPVYRVIAPVLVGAFAVNGLSMVNQEVVIPNIASELQKRHDDPGDRLLNVRPAYDDRGILLNGSKCYRGEKAIRPAFITLPQSLEGSIVELYAAEAIYQPPTEQYPSGGWILRDLSPEKPALRSDAVRPRDGDYFLETSISFDQISRSQSWFNYLSTPDLIREMGWAPAAMQPEMKVTLHTRLTKPLANLTLLFLGLPFVLSGASQGMIKLLGVSLVISFGFHLFSYSCQRLGTTEALPVSLAVWLPVLVFGTAAIVLTDLVRS